VISRISRTIAATVSGGATQSYNTSALNNGGDVLAIAYTRATASAPSTAAGLTITGTLAGMEYLNVTTTGAGGVKTWFYPSVLLQDTSGAGRAYTTNATPPGVPAYLPIAAGEAFNIDLASATGAGQGCSNGGLGISLDFYLRT
jgi:hypothetical protein